jgi:hypothetical protein
MTAEYVNEKGLWDCAVLNLVVYEILGAKFWEQKKRSVEAKQKADPPETTIFPKQIKFERPSWLNR